MTDQLRELLGLSRAVSSLNRTKPSAWCSPALYTVVIEHDVL